MGHSAYTAYKDHPLTHNALTLRHEQPFMEKSPHPMPDRFADQLCPFDTYPYCDNVNTRVAIEQDIGASWITDAGQSIGINTHHIDVIGKHSEQNHQSFVQAQETFSLSPDILADATTALGVFNFAAAGLGFLRAFGQLNHHVTTHQVHNDNVKLMALFAIGMICTALALPVTGLPAIAATVAKTSLIIGSHVILSANAKHIRKTRQNGQAIQEMIPKL